MNEEMYKAMTRKHFRWGVLFRHEHVNCKVLNG